MKKAFSPQRTIVHDKSFSETRCDNDIISRHFRSKERSSIVDLISEKRQMLLLNMQINTQQEQIKKLEEQLKNREMLLKDKESEIERAVQRFDSLVKEIDKMAQDSQLLIDSKRSKRFQKQQELIAITQEIQTTEESMERYSADLDECLKCEEFLDTLTPSAWFDHCLSEKRNRQSQRRRERINKFKEALQTQHEMTLTPKHASEVLTKTASKIPRNITLQVDDLNDEVLRKPEPNVEDEPVTSSDEEHSVYFKEPIQLLDKFSALETDNSFLIKQVQQREGILYELNVQIDQMSEDLDLHNGFTKNDEL